MLEFTFNECKNKMVMIKIIDSMDDYNFNRITLLSNFLVKTLTVDDVLDYIKESGYESLNTWHLGALKGWPLEELDDDI